MVLHGFSSRNPKNTVFSLENLKMKSELKGIQIQNINKQKEIEQVKEKMHQFEDKSKHKKTQSTKV